MPQQLTQKALNLANLSLRCVCANLPHLSGLAHNVELIVEPRVQTAAVTPSGRVLVNPEWFTKLKLEDASFVIAHELLHLAFRHHDRMDTNVDPLLANIAADCVINDMLTDELKQEVPGNGFRVYGARDMSTEGIIQELLRRGLDSSTPSWYSEPSGPMIVTALSQKLSEAGLAPEPQTEQIEDSRIAHDLIPEAIERQWYPESRQVHEQRVSQTQELAAKVLPLSALRERMSQTLIRGTYTGGRHSVIDALKTRYRPPWELALQRWMESTIPTGRTWSRASRRGADRTDIALPGRSREGWTLNLVLDTSGSMSAVQAYVLGVIASFCNASNVNDIRILQCDTAVTVDERVSPDELSKYKLSGFGGSDMSPAMNLLALDYQVEAVVVVTDGAIHYPDSVPYRVLWAQTSKFQFQPPYGYVIPLER